MKTAAGHLSPLLRMCLALLCFVWIAFGTETHAEPPSALKVFFIDVEGGQATLFVTPDGHSLLVDTGWPGNGGRDAERIAAAAKQAGVSKLDYVLLTHYHTDHVGGLPQLVARIPVGTFLDHGVNRELDGGLTQDGYDKYQVVLHSGQSKHLVMHPGQDLQIGGLALHVISADGQLIGKPLAGAGEPNPACAVSQKRSPDQTENARSLGVLLTYGSLRMLDLGDLTWDKEMELMCPNDRLGHADILIVSHHGWYQSSSPALVYPVHPRVAIMDNGETKGGSVPTMVTLSKSPGLETLWQLHFSAEGGRDHNTDSQYIANLQGTDPGNYLELTGERDGSFTVLNSRTGAVKSYPAPASTARLR